MQELSLTFFFFFFFFFFLTLSPGPHVGLSYKKKRDTKTGLDVIVMIYRCFPLSLWTTWSILELMHVNKKQYIISRVERKTGVSQMVVFPQT